jgi:signal recognition particle receptor subunit beta
MAQSILVIADSGTGKSTSIRTLDPKETFIINIANKQRKPKR